LGDDHRGTPLDEIGGQSWQAIELTSRPPGFNHSISTFDDTCFLQALAQGSQKGRERFG